MWVVVVTMSAYSKGCAAWRAATRPLMWAMSIISSAPTLSAEPRVVWCVGGEAGGAGKVMQAK